MQPRLIRATLAFACAAASIQAAAQSGSSPRPSGLTTAGPAAPNVFGTATVGAGVTFYDSRFRRVAKTDRNHPLVMSMAKPLIGLSPEQQLTAVHTAVAQKVRWAHDLDTMRVADLWANAGETLERGAGDSEDIAIVKMQVLKAAGWNPRDLFISIGREKGIGAHIVLLAHAPSGFYVLDDRASRPLSPREHARFTPILTLTEGKSYIHGRRVSGGASRVSAR